MKGWLAKVWHDPVGSNVIAVAIVAVVGALWVWGKSGWSGSLTVIWASAYALLAGPITIPFGIALLTLAAFAAIFIWLFTQRRALREQCAQLHSAADTASATLQKYERARESEAASLEQQREKIRQVLAIGLKEQRVMEVLARAYPESVQMHQVAAELQMLFAAVEKICEDVAAEGFLTIIASEHQPMKAVLTKPGRDYLMLLEEYRPS